MYKNETIEKLIDKIANACDCVGGCPVWLECKKTYDMRDHEIIFDYCKRKIKQTLTGWDGEEND